MKAALVGRPWQTRNTKLVKPFLVVIPIRADKVVILIPVQAIIRPIADVRRAQKMFGILSCPTEVLAEIEFPILFLTWVEASMKRGHAYKWEILNFPRNVPCAIP